MKLRTLSMILVVLVVLSGLASAKSNYVSRVPNGSKFGCSTCHTNAPSLNSFGRQYDDNSNWSALSKLDADGDGYTNGVELQDPNGTWTSGAIGDASKVTNPGDASSHPTSVFESKGSNSVKLIVDIPEYSGIATLKFTLDNPGNTYAVVYDLMGNILLKTEFGNLAEGSYNMLLPLTNEDGASIGKGVFFVRIVSGKSIITAKIVL